jgi:hypothetical protein
LEVTSNNAGDALQHLGELILTSRKGTEVQRVALWQRPAIAQQSLLMFICGSNLYSYYEQNLNDVAQALSQNILPLGRIVAFTQPSGADGYVVEYRYNELTNGCQRDTLLRYTDLGKTTDSEVMGSILRDMAALAPARHYALQLGSHAKGWLPATIERSAFRKTSEQADDVLWYKIPGAIETRWFGYDRGLYMDIDALREALLSAGVHFDYLLFDACFMASIEALYDLRDVTDYVLASPCEVMAHGFPYDTVIPALFQSDGASYSLEEACRQIYQYYSEQASTRSSCTSVAVCDQLDALATAVQAIYATTDKSADASSLQSYDGMSSHQFYDLGDLMKQLAPDETLYSAFLTQLNRAFPASCRLHTENFFSAYNYKLNAINNYSGVSTYDPATTYRSEWLDTAWYKATHR